MKDAGYQYIVIDDCWQIDRDAQGNIIPDPNIFHLESRLWPIMFIRKGLEVGLSPTRELLPARCDQAVVVMNSRRSAVCRVGRDYLKYDWCSSGTQNAQASYSIMRDALLKSGRPIVF